MFDKLLSTAAAVVLLGCSTGRTRPSTRLDKWWVVTNVAIIQSMARCSDCAELKQGEEVSIPYARIAGYQAGMPMARLYWWKWVPGSRGLEVSGFTQAGVELR